jgi:CRISPR type III-A-associated protein Csm2
MADKPKTFKSFGDMRGGGPTQPRRPDQRAQPDLPPDYLQGGYFDVQNLRREIFIEWPQAITQSLRGVRPPATKNSLRAFYAMLRMAKTQFDAQRADQSKAQADATTQLYKLRTAAQYQQTRAVISQLCHRFLTKNIDAVLERGKDFDSFQKNFNAFVEHFQAVIAYLPEKA